MKMLKLTARIRRKRKYSSYHGEVGRKLRTLFNAILKLKNRGKLLYMDITEFSIPTSNQTIFITNFRWYNSESIAYSLSSSPNLNQIKRYARKSTRRTMREYYSYSDQEWQYQHGFIIIFRRQRSALYVQR